MRKIIFSLIFFFALTTLASKSPAITFADDLAKPAECDDGLYTIGCTEGNKVCKPMCCNPANTTTVLFNSVIGEKITCAGYGGFGLITKDQYDSAVATGTLTSPRYCDPHYKLSPDDGMCLIDQFKAPGTCGSFETDGWLTREIVAAAGRNTCCVVMATGCDKAQTCTEASYTKRQSGLGKDENKYCLLGYLNQCNSQFYDLKSSNSGPVCVIDTDKIPNYSGQSYSATDFQGVCKDGHVDTAIGCIPTGDFKQTLGFALQWLFLAAGGIIITLVIKNGFTLLTSAGNPEKLKEVRESVTSIITGVLLIIFSLTILKIVGADILGLPGF